ncbi:MAG TPA: hypothetical protein VLA49_12535 [Anaerolineales bacterium]|nr:hypothetical protein [Anaerolineales bacterium]
MKSHKGRYRNESSRLPGWDYASPGYYFVTIVTERRRLLFGNTLHGEMPLSLLGEIAQRCWIEIPSHFPNTNLDEFVVMPNHIHGIVIINDVPRVETLHVASLQTAENEKMRKFGPLKPGSLSKIIQAYKSASSAGPAKTTFQISPGNPDFMITLYETKEIYI